MSTFGLIIDIVLVLILVIFGIIGFKKGFLKSLLALFSWFVCIVVACLVAQFVAKWINGIYDFSSLIGGKISEAFASMGETFSKDIASFAGDKAALLADIELNCNINGFLFQFIKVVVSSLNITDATGTVGEFIGMSIGNICMIIISGVLVFIVLRIVIALLSKIFDKIAKTKILGGLNKILGLAFGLIKGALVILIFNFILVGLSLVPMINNTITPIIQDHTHVEKFIYNKTDEFVGKYVIEGNIIQVWITNLWNSR